MSNRLKTILSRPQRSIFVHASNYTKLRGTVFPILILSVSPMALVLIYALKSTEPPGLCPY